MKAKKAFAGLEPRLGAVLIDLGGALIWRSVVVR
jgi:hypothetical protein